MFTSMRSRSSSFVEMSTLPTGASAPYALYARYYDRAHFKTRRTAESERSVGGDGAMARLCEPLDPAASPDS